MDDVNKIKIQLLDIKMGDKVLDLGCSFGEQAIMLARRGFKVTGIDSSKKRIEILNQHAKKKNLDCKGFVGDIKKLPFKTNSFDAIVATEVFEHVFDPQAAVDESFRVLKSGGRACVSVPTNLSEIILRKIHPNWEKNSGHINIYTKKQILAILTKSGFRVIRIENQNFEWSVFWLIHSFLRTKFDDTGTPKENVIISKGYFKVWKILNELKIGKFIMIAGNKIFPKSIYVYLIKP